MDTTQNASDVLQEVANAVDWTVATVEPTNNQTAVVTEEQTITAPTTIQEDSNTQKTLNEVAMGKELETEQSKREKELEEFVSKQMPNDVEQKPNTTLWNTWDVVSEIPTLDKPLSDDLEKKAAEAKKLDEVLEANRQLVKAYKVLKNQYNDIVDIANERIKLANTLYKEEAEKSARAISDPKRVILDDKMFLLNSLRNEYQKDRSESNRQKYAQNLVLMLSTLFPTIQPNDMIKFINNSANRVNTIWESKTSAQPQKVIPAPSFSIPRWLPKSQRGILG